MDKLLIQKKILFNEKFVTSWKEYSPVVKDEKAGRSSKQKNEQLITG